MEKEPVLFFDGDCLLCNRAVRWVFNLDRTQSIQFANLDQANELLASNNWDSNSLVFYANKQIYQRSQAVLKIVTYFPWYMQFLQLFRILPYRFLDRIYNFIAQNRYHWFGQVKSCHWNPALKARMIDSNNGNFEKSPSASSE